MDAGGGDRSGDVAPEERAADEERIREAGEDAGSKGAASDQQPRGDAVDHGGTRTQPVEDGGGRPVLELEVEGVRQPGGVYRMGGEVDDRSAAEHDAKEPVGAGIQIGIPRDNSRRTNVVAPRAAFQQTASRPPTNCRASRAVLARPETPRPTSSTASAISSRDRRSAVATARSPKAKRSRRSVLAADGTSDDAGRSMWCVSWTAGSATSARIFSVRGIQQVVAPRNVVKSLPVGQVETGFEILARCLICC